MPDTQVKLFDSKDIRTLWDSGIFPSLILLQL